MARYSATGYSTFILGQKPDILPNIRPNTEFDIRVDIRSINGRLLKEVSALTVEAGVVAKVPELHGLLPDVAADPGHVHRAVNRQVVVVTLV